MENKRILFKLWRLMCIVSLYLISNGCVMMSLRVCCLLYLHYFLSPDDDGDLISTASVRMIWMYLSLLTTKEKFRPFLNNDTLVLSLAWKVDYKIIQQLLTGPWNYRSSSSQNIGQLNGGAGAGRGRGTGQCVALQYVWGIFGNRRNLNKSWSSRVGERRGEGHHGSKPEDGDHEGRVMQGWARLWMWGGGRSGTQLRISENIINNRDQAHAWLHRGRRDTVSEPRPGNCSNWLIPARGQARVIWASARAARHPD